MVLLTATLPPTEEEKLYERMYWKREEVHMIRASTVRRNIQYSVVDGSASRAERDAQLEEIVGGVLRDDRRPEDKVVIMCESKPKVREIVEAGLFPCEMFHADLPEETKEETLNEFRAGNIRVIVATGAFGMGIDIPDIRLIVHVDSPRSMMDYGQASGRAGRDGLPSRAIIIRGGLEFEDELIKQYMDAETGQCRRMVIDKYLDGDMERQQCQEGEIFCDICERQMQDTGMTQAQEGTQAHEIGQAPGTTQVPTRPDVDRSRMYREIEVQDQRRQIPEARRVREVRTSAVVRQEVRQRLERWKGVCVICHQAGRNENHSISRCKQSESTMAESERKIVQRRIKFVGNVVCYKCGVPPILCDRWTADGQHVKEGEACQFFGVLIGVVYGIKHAYPEVWNSWVRRASRQATEQLDNDEAIERFLGKPSNNDGFASNGLLQAFMWMTKKIVPSEG